MSRPYFVYGLQFRVYRWSLKIDHCDACTTELNVFVAIVRNVGYGSQILAYQLAQNTRSCAVKDAYSRHANEDGVVDEIGNGIDGFVASHASHVEILTEVQLAVVDHVTRVFRYQSIGACDVAVALFGLREWGGRLLCAFKTVGSHLRPHAAEDDYRLTAADALYLTNGGETLDADGVAGLQR